MKRAFVRVTEHLKAMSANIIDQYQEGEVKDPAEAKAKLWALIQGALQDISKNAFRDVAWFRVASDPAEMRRALALAGELGEVVTANMIGPREPGQPGVLYVTAHVRTAVNAAQTVLNLTEAGFHVRDWWFGCVRR